MFTKGSGFRVQGSIRILETACYKRCIRVLLERFRVGL